jgi:plastocyanin
MLSVLLASRVAGAENVDVSARVRVLPSKETTVHTAHPVPKATMTAVIWLTAVDSGSIPSPAPSSYTLAQKNKEFSPHLLIIPVGSTVQFPNQDPFFHNVFSLFDGRRFDLGLYEAGSTRSVRFTREGVSYVFCNIHPDMSAVILTLGSPYFAIAGENGNAVIRDVPSGQYRLHVWSEGQDLERLNALARVVRVAPNSANLGVIEIPRSDDLTTHHKNKFGEDYDKAAPPIY